jgi:hypothetical protein
LASTIPWRIWERSELAMPWPQLWSSATKDEPKEKDSVTSRITRAADAASETASATASATVNAVSDASKTGDPVPRQLSRSLSSQLASLTEPQTVVGAVLLTTASLGLFKFYKTYLKRIPQATNINPGLFRRRSLVGKVTSVGDGDNFRFYHTPGGRLAGWGWLPGRRVPADKKELKDQTVRADTTFTVRASENFKD